MRTDTEKKLGRTFGIFDAVNYRTQAVSGTNCLAEVGADQFVHIKVQKAQMKFGLFQKKLSQNVWEEA